MYCSSCGREIGDSKYCPICGAETSDFYKSKVTGEVVGCYECVRYCDAWEETA